MLIQLKQNSAQQSMDVTKEIIIACKRDDRKAIEFLYEYCFRLLMPVCFRYNRNEEDARAALNNGFMKILKGLESVDESVNFRAWSKRIMVNSLIDDYRKQKNYSSRIAMKETDRELENAARSAENEAESDLGYEQLMRLVDELPEISAKVFRLYVIEGYNHKEIGETLNISEGTSKWHLSTARKNLREKLEKIEKNLQKMVI